MRGAAPSCNALQGYEVKPRGEVAPGSFTVLGGGLPLALATPPPGLGALAPRSAQTPLQHALPGRVSTAKGKPLANNTDH